jgi:hypothetical protein
VTKYLTVFHISQTEETSERSQSRQESTAHGLTVARTVTELSGGNWAGRYRVYADKLQPKIDHATRPMSQNPTPKRNREYQSRLWEGRNMARTQKALRAIADAMDAGTLPVELAGVIKKDGSGISSLVHKGMDG